MVKDVEMSPSEACYTMLDVVHVVLRLLRLDFEILGLEVMMSPLIGSSDSDFREKGKAIAGRPCEHIWT